ncbi:cell cycle arrest protein [Scheffersomyces coipomensis]|uniref:cell cycle arrest protein n=1 Tax=Scheffersomyces coipomensis TaxID=1788519 RepID=UPI00315CD064
MTSSNKFVELITPKDLDIVSDVKFSPSPLNQQLLVSSWDNQILLYDCSTISSNANNPPQISPTNVFKLYDTPLSVTYKSDNLAYVGLLDGSIRQLDFTTLGVSDVNLGGSLNESMIGGGINNLISIKNDPNLLCASSFNGKLQLIDTRTNQSSYIANEIHHQGGSPSLKRKIFNMDSSSQYLTLALNGNNIEIYDLKNLKTPFETRQVGLNYQIRDLKCFPNDEGFALSTIDGRVSIEYFDSSPEVQATKRFTYKCHRSYDKLTDTDVVYPVNTIGFTNYGTLFTGGADGALCLWDLEKRKRMRAYPKFVSEDEEEVPESISKIDLSNNSDENDQQLIAVATSDDTYKRRRRLSESEGQRVPSRVYVRVLSDGECAPKA